MKLQEYNITIHYRKGKANANADALSRPRITDTLIIANELLSQLRNLNSCEDLKQFGEEDEEISEIKQKLPQTDQQKQPELR